MSILKSISSFTALNFTQFFAALNDNLYKLILVFFIISIEGEEHSNTILSLAGAIFVIPFILFAAPSGTLADRYSKQKVIYITRIGEVIAMFLGLVAIIFHSPVGGYIALFLIATQSALFSPCKYGIIPEIVKKDKVLHCNGVITGTTYLAIILGTFLASFVTEITHRNFVFTVSICVVIALIGLLWSLFIEKTAPQAPKKKFSLRFFAIILRSLKRAKRRRYLLAVIVFGAYFLFVGAYAQLNIIPFTIQSLHLSEIHGGYLFLMTAIGIGIGSFLAGRLAGNEVELGLIPLATLGVAICNMGLYVFDAYFFIVIFLLILFGLFGGFFIVPIDAFIQVASPEKERGQNLATLNFLSFIGVIIASGCIAFFGSLLGLTAAAGFFIVGILTLLLGFVLLFLFADQVLRLIVATGARWFCIIRVRGRNRIANIKPTLLVAPRLSWLDTIVIMATLPRMIRYIVPVKNGSKPLTLLYRLLWLIPLDIEHFSPIGPLALRTIKAELKSGHPVCLMQPVDMPSTNLKEWEKALENILKDIQVPVMPVHISRPNPEKPGRLAGLKSLLRGTIRVIYGPCITASLTDQVK